MHDSERTEGAASAPTAAGGETEASAAAGETTEHSRGEDDPAEEALVDACVAGWARAAGVGQDALDALHERTRAGSARLTEALADAGLVAPAALEAALGEGLLLVPCSGCTAAYSLGAALLPYAEEVPCPSCGGALDQAALERLQDQTLLPELDRRASTAPSARTPGPVGGLEPGQTFQHYRVDAELGRGGMGVVYAAYHTGLKQPVALKVLLRGTLASPAARRRFFREAEAAAALEHRYVVSVLDVGEVDGLCYLAMDRVEGVRLSEFVAAGRPLEDALTLFVKVCSGVHHAHTRGVIHRDLKPDNVLVDAAGDPRILDFGVAKRLDDDDESRSATLTEEGDMVGTLRYMPPEQAEGRLEEVDARSDVYALGVILYMLLSGGEAPFRGNPAQVLKQILEADPAPPSALATVPWELDAICLKALSKAREQRYQSAYAFLQDVERYLHGVPVLARRAGVAYRARKWVRRHRLRAGLVAGGLLLTGVAAAGAGLASWRAERERRAQIEGRAHEGWLAASQRELDRAVARWGGVDRDLAPTDLLELPPETAALVAQELRPSGEAPYLTRDVLRAWIAWAGIQRVLQRAHDLTARAEIALARGNDEEASDLIRAALREAPQAAGVRDACERLGQVFLAKARAALAAEAAEAPDAFPARAASLRFAELELERARRLLPDAEEASEVQELLGARSSALAVARQTQGLRRLAAERLSAGVRLLEQAEARRGAPTAELDELLTDARIALEVADSADAGPAITDALGRLWLERARLSLREGRVDRAGTQLLRAQDLGRRDPELEAALRGR